MLALFVPPVPVNGDDVCPVDPGLPWIIFWTAFSGEYPFIPPYINMMPMLVLIRPVPDNLAISIVRSE